MKKEGFKKKYMNKKLLLALIAIIFVVIAIFFIKSTFVPKDVKEYIEKLSSQNPQERADSVIALGNMGERAAPSIPFLIARLNDEEYYVFENSVNALVKIGKPAVNPLIIVFKGKDKNIRWRVASVLVKIGSPSVKPLIAALQG